MIFYKLLDDVCTKDNKLKKHKMNMEISKILIGLLVLLSFMLGYYLSPLMPEQMGCHWDIYGNLNGYISKFWGLFALPCVMLLMFIMYLAFPKIDPKKRSYKSFKKEFDNFIAVIFTFLMIMYITVIAWNLGIEINIQKITIIGIAALIYFSANLVEKAEQNWFVGIKTPWTLSDKEVWKKTHKLGGKLYRISAVLTLPGAFTKGRISLLFILPVIITSIYLVSYSYIQYKKKN